MADTIRRAYVSLDVEPFYIGATPAVFAKDVPLVATPMNENVVVTDLDTGSVLHTLEGDGEPVTCLAMTPDGSRLAVVSQSQQLRVYEVQSGALVKQYKFQAPVYIASADDTLTLFAFGATDGMVTVWDIAGGYVTHALKGHGTTICSLAFYGHLHSSEWMLASGDTMGTCKVWNLATRKCVATNNEHTGAVRGLAFLKDGQYFVSGGRDEVVVLYERHALRKSVATFLVRHQVETCGFVSVAGRQMLYTAGTEGCLKLWDRELGRPLGGSRKPMQTLEELVAIDVAETQGGRLLWMVLSDQTLVEMNVEEIRTVNGPDSDSSSASGPTFVVPVARTVAGNHGIIADIRYAGPGLSLVAMATNAPALRVIDPNHPLDVHLYEAHTDLLNCLDASEDGSWLVTGSKDHTARLWHYDAGSHRFYVHTTFVGHAGGVTACALAKSQTQTQTKAKAKAQASNSAQEAMAQTMTQTMAQEPRDGEPSKQPQSIVGVAAPRFVITAAEDLTVKKWRVPASAGETVRASEYTRRAHEKDINAVAVAPNDEVFATASFDKTAKVWNTASGETVGVLRGHKRGLWDVSFCQYDRILATCAGDKTVRVWLMADYTCTKTLEGHTNAVQRCQFISQNRQVVSTGADGLVKVWDLRDSECVATLDNHANRIWAMDVSGDGLHMVSADADGYLSFWTDNTAELMQQQQAQAQERVEQEQLLANYITANDWSNAFLLALTLDHLMRLYNVVKALIAANSDVKLPVGSGLLEDTMKRLDLAQMAVLLKKLRDWNINFKQFEIAQKVLAVVLEQISMDDGETRGIVDLIIPYNERHMHRLDAMLEETYVLDYVVQEMEKA